MALLEEDELFTAYLSVSIDITQILDISIIEQCSGLEYFGGMIRLLHETGCILFEQPAASGMVGQAGWAVAARGKDQEFLHTTNNLSRPIKQHCLQQNLQRTKCNCAIGLMPLQSTVIQRAEMQIIETNFLSIPEQNYST